MKRVLRSLLGGIALAVLSVPAQAQAPTPLASPLRFGIDTYFGASNAPGFRWMSDQFWAGQTTYTPSVAYLRWDGAQGRSARLALGIGQQANGADAMYRQPVEAWWKQPVGSGALTVGRFFGVFGMGEWQYEAKDGVQWEQSLGKFSLTAALQDDRATRRGNLYARGALAVGEDGSVGLSLARGRGFSYGTSFDRGYGIDALLPVGGWTLRGEASQLQQPAGGRFRFVMGSASFAAGKNVEPFVSYYRWQDTSAGSEMGDFRSAIVGVNWQATPTLSVETAAARAGGQNVAWIQFHFAWER